MKKALMFVLMALLACSLYAGGQQQSAAAQIVYDREEYKVVDPMLTPDQAKRGGILRLRISSAPQSFNFYGTLDSAAYLVLFNMIDALVDMHPVTNALEPGLAKSWEVSPDGKTVTFHLRKIKWSDGTPFTAGDVIFTFRNFLLNKFAEGNSIARFTIQGEVVRFEEVDDHTIRAYLPAPYGPFFTVLSHASIYPRHILADKIDPIDPGSVNNVWTTDTPPSQLVGTGPFVIDQYVVDQKVVMARNPYYWKADREMNPLPYMDRLEYLIVKDDQLTGAKFMAGEIDYLRASAAEFPGLKERELAGGPFIVYAAEPIRNVPSPLHLTFNFDAQDPELARLFSAKGFRVAMEYALDRERIIEEVYNTLAVPGGVPVLPANKAFYNPKIEEIRRGHDPQEAARLLKELNLEDRNGDGWLDLPGGDTLEFTLLVSTNQTQQDAALIISEGLKDLGVKCELQIVDGSLRAQKALSGDFQASLWAFGNQPDPQLRKAIWQPGNPLYYCHFQTMDPETKRPIPEEMTDWEREVYWAFEKGQTAMDPAERKRHYDRWQEIYAEYVPFIFICKGMDLMGAHKTIGNFYQQEGGALVYTQYTVYRK